MKRLFSLSLILLMPLLALAASLLQFSGDVLDEQTVELRWRVDSVQGVASFEVERSTDDEHYQLLGERVLVNGALEYSLLDHPGLNSAGGSRDRFTDIEQVYYYRLYYVLPSGGRLAAQSSPLAVSFQFSTVEATWGSIKAMFR
ncbi:MAG: hypothetical protein WC326_12675 [Candidatus Delongbacteria bacterium]